MPYFHQKSQASHSNWTLVDSLILWRPLAENLVFWDLKNLVVLKDNDLGLSQKLTFFFLFLRKSDLLSLSRSHFLLTSFRLWWCMAGGWVVAGGHQDVPTHKGTNFFGIFNFFFFGNFKAFGYTVRRFFFSFFLGGKKEKWPLVSPTQVLTSL